MNEIFIYNYKFPINFSVDKGSGKMFYTNQEFRKFFLQKNLDNIFKINLKNTDNKNLAITDEFLYATIFNDERLVLKKKLTPLVREEGKFQLVLTKEEVENIDVGYYKISITMLDDLETPLFTNFTDATYLELEVIDTIKSRAIPTEVKSFHVVETVNNNGITAAYRYSTNKLVASTKVKTIAVYSTNYKGKIYVEGSILKIPDSMPTSKDWFKIQINSSDYVNIQANPVQANIGKTGVTGFNIDVPCYWIRIFSEADPDNSGTIDKILYLY